MSDLIGIASDHAGKELKRKVIEYLEKDGVSVRDFGVDLNQTESVNYPDYAAKLGHAISTGEVNRGIAICGTGIGMCITANKIPGVRATSVWDEFTAEMSRKHNDSNVLCLGDRALDHDLALKITNIWLNTEFEGGRHQNRLDLIHQLEKP